MSNSIEQKVVTVDKILLKRGNLEENSTYVGALGELTFDTDLRTARVHDGTTPGGDPLPTAANVDAAIISSLTSVDGNIIPSLDLVYDLGSDDLKWKNVYVGGNIHFSDNTVQSTAFTGQTSYTSSELQIVDNFTSVEYDCTVVNKFYHSLPTESWDVNFANIGTTANTSSVVTLYIEQGPTPFLPGNISVNGSAVNVTWDGNLTGNADTVDVLNYTVLNVSGNIKVLGWTDTLFYLGQ